MKGLIKEPLKEGGVPPLYLLPRRDEDEDNCRILCFERRLISKVVFGLPKMLIWALNWVVELLILLIKIVVFVVKLPFAALYYFFYFFYWLATGGR